MNKKIIIGVVAVLVVGGVILFASEKSGENHSNDTATEATSQSAASSESANTTASSETATITYTDNGFAPATITVKSGTTVTVKNASSNSLQFDSDPHPQHTNNKELNVDDVPPGSSQTFVADTKGTFGYHNHLNASDTGTIIVN